MALHYSLAYKRVVTIPQIFFLCSRDVIPRKLYRCFKTKFAGDVIFFKKGKYYEFFEDDKDTALKLGLKKMNRHSDRNTKYGFPIWLEKSFSDKISRMGRCLTVITEGERYLTGIKERFPKYRLVAQL